MRISTSNVAMESSRTYMAVQADLFSYSGWGNQAEDNSTLPTAKDGVQQTVNGNGQEGIKGMSTEEMLEQLFQQQRSVESKKMTFQNLGETQFQARDPIEFDTFRNLLELLLGIRRRKSYWHEKLANAMSSQQTAVPVVYNTQEIPAANMAYSEAHFFGEKEETAFYSSGKVVTEDGRKIDFDVTAYMSRSFCEYTQMEINYQKAACVDPLVINLNGGNAEVRDQKFLFDLDCDGKMDNIAMLKEACGFLALDKNNDGVINDGSELFGTKTGNGFEELAVFDFDGNGWIDENDPVFNQLRIWTKDESGKDKLVGLGVAGVGAIYLGNISTPFTLNSSASNAMQGQIRRTGVFLKENGEAGTIQHVDLAVGEAS